MTSPKKRPTNNFGIRGHERSGAAKRRRGKCRIQFCDVAKIYLVVLALLGAVALSLPAAAAPVDTPDVLSKSPDWQPLGRDQVRQQALDWLRAQKPEEKVLKQAEQLWDAVPDDAAEPEILQQLAATFALTDERAAALVELCSQPRTGYKLAEQSWLHDEKTDPFLAANLRLYYARWLAHEVLYDEAQQSLADLTPDDVVAPATLLFYQGVVAHMLLDKEAGLAALDELLDGAASSPQRYVALSRLMQEDLKTVKEESLDHIARRMDDVRRRLDLGRGGNKVRKVQDGIIESLDKIIKKLEEQQQNQQGGGSSSDNIQSSSPAPDSQLIGGKGPGQVTKRDIGSEDNWGKMPPKEREEALQKIGRDFPAHYRDVVEQYFRRLAAEGGSP